MVASRGAGKMGEEAPNSKRLKSELRDRWKSWRINICTVLLDGSFLLVWKFVEWVMKIAKVQHDAMYWTIY